MLLIHLFENKHMTEADTASVNWNTRSESGVVEGGEKDRQWSNKDMEKLRVATRDFDDILSADGPDAFKQELIKKRIKTKPMAGPKGVLPEQGVAEDELDEGIRDKLAAAALAGTLALGAGGAQARVVPDGQGGYTSGFGGKPVATQMAPAQPSAEMPNQNLQAVDAVEVTADGITITQDGKSYDVRTVPKDSPTPRNGKKMKVNQAQVGERGIGSYVVYLVNNGTAYLYKGSVNEGDISQLEKAVADAPVEPIANMEATEKVGNMDADAFDAAMARLKKLAGAGPMKTVWDPAKRVYKNVPTAVQPKK